LLLGIAFWRARPRRSSAWIAPGYSAGVVANLLWGHATSLTWPPEVRFCLAALALAPRSLRACMASLLDQREIMTDAIDALWAAV
jgi:hypothetical protein